MEPQAPRFSDVTDGHVGETSDIAAVDDIEWDQDRDGQECAPSKEHTKEGNVITQ